MIAYLVIGAFIGAVSYWSVPSIDRDIIVIPMAMLFWLPIALFMLVSRIFE